MILKMTKNTENKVKVNKSKSYLLPLLNEYVKIEYLHLLENTFINIDGYLECIALLYKNDSSDDNYIKHLRMLMDNSLLKSTLYMSEHTLFIFEFPEQFLNEYKYFKLGRYSKFSNDAKKKIIRFFSNNYRYPDIVQEVVHILYKNKLRKERLEEQLGVKLSNDDELASIIDEEEETFKLEDYGY